MSSNKDYLTDRLHKKEKAEEDRYFEEQSRRQIEKLREAHAKSTAAGTGICPRCGAALQVVERHGGAVDACPKGHGMWFDQADFDEITKREGEGWLARLRFGRRSK